MALTITLLLPAGLAASSAGASATSNIAPSCRASQITPSLSIANTPYSAKADFTATMYFYNSGATCEFTGNDIPIQPVSGPRHTPVGVGSLSDAVAHPSFTLQHGRRAFATVDIGSIHSAEFLKLVGKYGPECKPVMADGIELVAFKGGMWPKAYFRLPHWLAVCTRNFLNVGMSNPLKVLTPAEARQQAILGATNELQHFLNLWKSTNQKTAEQYFVVPRQRVDNFVLKSGQVLTSPVSVVYWRSSRDFSLLVALDLHFVGAHGTWRQGINERIVTFTHSGSSPQLMSFVIPSLPG